MFGVGGVELAYLTAVFLLGGFVKGVISFGLPLVTVPLLSQIFPVPVAITLTLVSVLVSSVVQAYLCRRAYQFYGRSGRSSCRSARQSPWRRSRPEP